MPRRRVLSYVLACLGWALLAGSLHAQEEATFEELTPRIPAGLDEWQFGYESWTTQVDGDAQIWVFRQPVFSRGRERVRATWAILWLDDDVADALGQRAAVPSLRLGGAAVLGSEERPRSITTLWDAIDSFAYTQHLREFYLEGPVEYFVDDDLVAFADAFYVDKIGRIGWIANANYEFIDRIGGSRFVFKIQARWLRLGSDGSLTSDSARLTTCEFAEPHFYITTRRLKITPTTERSSRERARVQAQGNAIRIGPRFRIPLPPIDDFLDEDGDLNLLGLQAGRSSRFGTVVGVEYNRDVRERFGARVNRILRGDPDDYRARLRLNASYLGSRGGLLDLGLRMRSADIYRFEADFGIVPDGARDRGLVQVPKEDREFVRTWLRARGRYHLDQDEWIDVAISHQSDPAVQSEFFEDDYLRFDLRESYVQWRRAPQADYASVAVSGTLESHRTEVQELPALRLARQRVPIASVGPWPILWGHVTSAGLYDRVTGDPDYEAPFGDGAGSGDLLRLDHSNRFEMPIPLGLAGLRLSPFLEVQGTGWSESAESSEAIARGALLGGMRLGTVFWRRSSSGALLELSPSLGYTRDLIVEEPDESPLDLFDEVDRSPEGQRVTAALRGRFIGAKWPLELDAEVRATHFSDGADGTPDGWEPLGVFAGGRSSILGVPVGITHDGRYDLDSGVTRYSRSRLTVQPHASLLLHAGFVQASDELGARIFETATFGGTYRFSPKWEFEGRRDISLRESTSLETRLTLRRYGHDVVLDIFGVDRSGEGGTTIGVRVRPILTAHRRPGVLQAP